MKKLLLPVVVLSLFCFTSCSSEHSENRQDAYFSVTLNAGETCYVYRVSSTGAVTQNWAATYTTGAVISQYSNYFTVKVETRLNYYSNSVFGYSFVTYA